jgi:hypothetical protein
MLADVHRWAGGQGGAPRDQSREAEVGLGTISQALAGPSLIRETGHVNRANCLMPSKMVDDSYFAPVN